eukprot:6827694-Pyramimonas_sp.AAC.1
MGGRYMREHRGVLAHGSRSSLLNIECARRVQGLTARVHAGNHNASLMCFPDPTKCRWESF